MGDGETPFSRRIKKSVFGKMSSYQTPFAVPTRVVAIHNNAIVYAICTACLCEVDARHPNIPRSNLCAYCRMEHGKLKATPNTMYSSFGDYFKKAESQE